MPPYVNVHRKHTAGRGHYVSIDLSDDAYRALVAAVEVAFDDIDSIPAGYADAAAALWHELVANIHAPS
jgi:hypothetical protein